MLRTIIFFNLLLVISNIVLASFCLCHVHGTNTSCNTTGCSNGPNSGCNAGAGAFVAVANDLVGCSCPSNGTVSLAFNGFNNYGFYNFTDCYSFGNIYLNGVGTIIFDPAIACCNFCCGTFS
jgi:hypothetical protein